MRHILAALIIIVSVVAPAWPVLANGGEFSSPEAVARWIAGYRASPDPARLPAAVRTLSESGAFKEPEGAGVYLGFIAGVLGANPDKAEALIAKMVSITPMDQWIIVRAIAYSDYPDWQTWMRNSADRMPMRKVMIEHYLDRRSPTLYDIPLERKDPTLWEKVVAHFQSGQSSKATVITLDRSPDLLDTLWGYYFATGSQRAIERIITLLPWSNERDSVDKLTMGNMAKYTLASNAARDPELLAILKRDAKTAPKKLAPVLNEVIEAAETVETTRLRKDALASIEELKRKGPGSKRDFSNWGLIGQGALSIGCIAAAATGHVELGLPCIIGGAASGAAMSYMNGHQ